MPKPVKFTTFYVDFVETDLGGKDSKRLIFELPDGNIGISSGLDSSPLPFLKLDRSKPKQVVKIHRKPRIKILTLLDGKPKTIICTFRSNHSASVFVSETGVSYDVPMLPAELDFSILKIKEQIASRMHLALYHVHDFFGGEFQKRQQSLHSSRKNQNTAQNCMGWDPETKPGYRRYETFGIPTALLQGNDHGRIF